MATTLPRERTMLDAATRTLLPADGLQGRDGVLGRMGGLVARLASDEADIRAAQRLRYRVFVEECGAATYGREHGLEADTLDGACDHLLVIDPARAGDDQVVGTYRLLRQQRARARDAAGVTPIVGIVSREVHHSVCIGDFIDGSQLQFGADLGPALVYPQ